MFKLRLRRLSFPNNAFLDSSKRKACLDDNSKFDEMAESSPKG